MKKYLFICLLITLATGMFAQNNLYKTNSAHVKFDAAKSNIEPIKAENKNVKLILNSNTGEIACLMNMTDFEFPNKLMQEHFNENYIESDKYAKATFTGSIKNFLALDFSKKQNITIAGQFNIHGKTQTKTVTATLQKNNNGYLLNSDFVLQLKDFNVKIPSIMFLKIAEEVHVNLKATLLLD